MSRFIRLRTKYDNNVSRAINKAGWSSVVKFAETYNFRQQTVQKWIRQGYVPRKHIRMFCGATGAKPEKVIHVRAA